MRNTAIDRKRRKAIYFQVIYSIRHNICDAHNIKMELFDITDLCTKAILI